MLQSCVWMHSRVCKAKRLLMPTPQAHMFYDGWWGINIKQRPCITGTSFAQVTRQIMFAKYHLANVVLKGKLAPNIVKWVNKNKTTLVWLTNRHRPLIIFQGNLLTHWYFIFDCLFKVGTSDNIDKIKHVQTRQIYLTSISAPKCHNVSQAFHTILRGKYSNSRTSKLDYFENCKETRRVVKNDSIYMWNRDKIYDLF